jgi:hypothetical protein
MVAVHSSAAAQPMPATGSLEALSAAEQVVAKLKDSPAATASTGRNALSGALQALGTAQAFTGDVDGAIATFDRERHAVNRPLSRGPADDINRINSAVAEDAIKAIVEEAKHRRVVFLNEAHHVPLHRAFAKRLAAELRKIGYTYLACEAFSPTDQAVRLGPHGEAVRGTGYYVQEPVFADFVSSAAADGWKLVSYEFPGDSIDERERGQARNLVDRIFAKDMNAKVFIYVGYGHENKWTEGSPLMTMAAYLHKMTGLDMLHVQQTNFYAHPDRADESEHYRELLDKFHAHEPFVLQSADGSHPVLLGMEQIVDMQVIFPQYGQVDGRAEWLATLLGRRPQPIPPELLPTQGLRLVKAYARGAPPDAVPVDAVMVRAGQPVPPLMLPKGDYVFKAEPDGVSAGGGG